jgi:hypothetical protein
MPLINIISDVSGLTSELRESRFALTRIAEALERLSPPVTGEDVQARPKLTPEQTVHHMAETPEQYELRMAQQSEFALTLGMNPSSPEFVDVINSFRQMLTEPRMEQNEQGGYEEKTFTQEESEAIIREAFAQAQSAVNAERKA